MGYKIQGKPLIYLIGAFTLLISLLILRMPRYFASPTFIQDDGYLFFGHAYSHGFWESLAAAYSNYVNIYANFFAAIAAHAVPLEYAPLVMLSGGILMLFFAALLLFSSASPFQSLISKSLALIILAFAAPVQSLASVNHSHFYMAAFLALILVSKPQTKNQKIAYRMASLLCAVSGPISLFLIPLFAAKAWMEKNKEHAIQCGILIACAVFQLASHYYAEGNYSKLNYHSGAGRFEGGFDGFIAWLFNYWVVKLFIGPAVSLELGRFVGP